jgi:hypothetical protein
MRSGPLVAQRRGPPLAGSAPEVVAEKGAAGEFYRRSAYEPERESAAARMAASLRGTLAGVAALSTSRRCWVATSAVDPEPTSATPNCHHSAMC